VVIWGGNYFADELPTSADWLVWHKANDGLTFAECEIAWTNLGCNCRHLTHHWGRETKQHVTAKPLPVVEWSMSWIASPTVFDPFCGSGTTILAAERAGKTCFAMEIDPRFCDVATRRYEELTHTTATRTTETAMNAKGQNERIAR
jgi:DNA modification methylase